MVYLALRKYPVIHTDDERECYKAVFQDQFSEYKELSAEVQAVLRKLDELDALMSRLPRRAENQQVSARSRLGGAPAVGGRIDPFEVQRGHNRPCLLSVSRKAI